MKIHIPTLAAAILCGAGTAHAQPVGRFQDAYVGAYFGDNEANDADIIIGGFATGNVGYANGYALGATLGANLLDDVRGEAEFAYRQNDINSINGGNDNGDVSAWALMANGFYDFTGVGEALNLGTTITPYVGGGIGLANVSWNGVTNGGAPYADDDDLVFAYQLGGGVGFGLFDTWMLTLDYRYFATTNPEIALVGGGTIETEFSNHTVVLGVRYGL